MTWILIPLLLLASVALTWLAHRALREDETPPEDPCAHPWYIDGRCIVCGVPR